MCATKLLQWVALVPCERLTKCGCGNLWLCRPSGFRYDVEVFLIIFSRIYIRETGEKKTIYLG